MEFEVEFEAFIESHIKRRSGERRRRLRAGLGHAERRFLENVWFPTFKHFKSLHPEYEVNDYKDGYRYLDFAYIKPHFRMAIEIDGFGTHWRNITKWQFSDHCHRQNHLIIDGWNVIRIPYDDIEERPRLCQQSIQQMMGRWLGSDVLPDHATSIERDIIRLAVRVSRPITPRNVCEFLQISPDYAQKVLHTLTEQEWLQPASGKVRIRSYRLHPSRQNIKL
jgi:very-short-patch-repair endonuclease